MGMIYHKKRAWAKLNEEAGNISDSSFFDPSAGQSSQKTNDSSSRENGEHANNQSSLPNSYTKTDIKRMSTAELQNLAAKSGVENAFETSGGELKEILIQKFNL